MNCRAMIGINIYSLPSMRRNTAM